MKTLLFLVLLSGTTALADCPPGEHAVGTGNFYCDYRTDTGTYDCWDESFCESDCVGICCLPVAGDQPVEAPSRKQTPLNDRRKR